METVQAQQMRSVPTEVVCVWMIVYINGCICNIHLPVGKYSMCAQCVLKWSSRYLTVYVGAQNGCLCACVYVFLLINVILTSPALAVAGKELVKQQLKRHVLGHDVVFAQVVAAGRAGVHLRSERPLETSLGRERERARWGRFTQTQGHVRLFVFFETLWLKIHPVRTHLANIVWANGGDGLESQLLAANTHEDLFHLAQEILYTYANRNTWRIYVTAAEGTHRSF